MSDTMYDFVYPKLREKDKYNQQLSEEKDQLSSSVALDILFTEDLKTKFRSQLLSNYSAEAVRKETEIAEKRTSINSKPILELLEELNYEDIVELLGGNQNVPDCLTRYLAAKRRVANSQKVNAIYEQAAFDAIEAEITQVNYPLTNLDGALMWVADQYLQPEDNRRTLYIMDSNTGCAIKYFVTETQQKPLVVLHEGFHYNRLKQRKNVSKDIISFPYERQFQTLKWMHDKILKLYDSNTIGPFYQTDDAISLYRTCLALTRLNSAHKFGMGEFCAEFIKNYNSFNLDRSVPHLSDEDSGNDGDTSSSESSRSSSPEQVRQPSVNLDIFRPVTPHRAKIAQEDNRFYADGYYYNYTVKRIGKPSSTVSPQVRIITPSLVSRKDAVTIVRDLVDQLGDKSAEIYVGLNYPAHKRSDYTSFDGYWLTDQETKLKEILREKASQHQVILTFGDWQATVMERQPVRDSNLFEGLTTNLSPEQKQQMIEYLKKRCILDKDNYCFQFSSVDFNQLKESFEAFSLTKSDWQQIMKNLQRFKKGTAVNATPVPQDFFDGVGKPAIGLIRNILLWEALKDNKSSIPTVSIDADWVNDGNRCGIPLGQILEETAGMTHSGTTPRLMSVPYKLKCSNGDPVNLFTQLAGDLDLNIRKALMAYAEKCKRSGSEQMYYYGYPSEHCLVMNERCSELLAEQFHELIGKDNLDQSKLKEFFGMADLEGFNILKKLKTLFHNSLLVSMSEHVVHTDGDRYEVKDFNLTPDLNSVFNVLNKLSQSHASTWHFTQILSWHFRKQQHLFMHLAKLFSFQDILSLIKSCETQDLKNNMLTYVENLQSFLLDPNNVTFKAYKDSLDDTASTDELHSICIENTNYLLDRLGSDSTKIVKIFKVWATSIINFVFQNIDNPFFSALNNEGQLSLHWQTAQSRWGQRSRPSLLFGEFVAKSESQPVRMDRPEKQTNYFKEHEQPGLDYKKLKSLLENLKKKQDQLDKKLTDLEKIFSTFLNGLFNSIDSNGNDLVETHKEELSKFLNENGHLKPKKIKRLFFAELDKQLKESDVVFKLTDSPEDSVKLLQGLKRYLSTFDSTIGYDELLDVFIKNQKIICDEGLDFDELDCDDDLKRALTQKFTQPNQNKRQIYKGKKGKKGKKRQISDRGDSEKSSKKPSEKPSKKSKIGPVQTFHQDDFDQFWESLDQDDGIVDFSEDLFSGQVGNKSRRKRSNSVDSVELLLEEFSKNQAIDPNGHSPDFDSNGSFILEEELDSLPKPGPLAELNGLLDQWVFNKDRDLQNKIFRKYIDLEQNPEIAGKLKTNKKLNEFMKRQAEKAIR